MKVRWCNKNGGKNERYVLIWLRHEMNVQMPWNFSTLIGWTFGLTSDQQADLSDNKEILSKGVIVSCQCGLCVCQSFLVSKSCQNRGKTGSGAFGKNGHVSASKKSRTFSIWGRFWCVRGVPLGGPFREGSCRPPAQGGAQMAARILQSPEAFSAWIFVKNSLILVFFFHDFSAIFSRHQLSGFELVPH